MTKHNAINQGRIRPKYFCFAPHKKSKQPNLLLVHDLQSTRFLSSRTCRQPHFRNMASKILNQMTMECTDSSATQETTGSAKLTPNSNCFASQLSCSHASSCSRCSLLSHLPLIIPCLAKAEVFGLSFPSTLGFCLIKESHVNRRSKRKREHTCDFFQGG